MALDSGWLINEADGEKLYFKLLNGSPYQVRIDPESADAPVLKLAPGYYDDDLNPVPETEALAPDEDEDEPDDNVEDLDELDEALAD